jgi:hypothetical protein
MEGIVLKKITVEANLLEMPILQFQAAKRAANKAIF